MAIEIRRTEPEIGVLVLSQFLEDRFVHELVDDRADGVGYLLKEKVAVNEPAAERLLHRTQWADDRCVRAVAARQWVI